MNYNPQVIERLPLEIRLALDVYNRKDEIRNNNGQAAGLDNLS